jgi:hypothetical protein
MTAVRVPVTKPQDHARGRIGQAIEPISGSGQREDSARSVCNWFLDLPAAGFLVAGAAVLLGFAMIEVSFEKQFAHLADWSIVRCQVGEPILLTGTSM